MNELAANIGAVRARIRAAAAACGRAEDGIALLAVAKAQSAAAVAAAHAAGLERFGENYLQESDAHIAAAPAAEWHFIGRVQSNKTRAIAARFAWVHAVDRLQIAERLSRQRPAGQPPLNLCIQLDIDDEPTKGGVAPAAADALAADIAALPGVRLRGLMAIPRPRLGFDAQRQPYAAVQAVFRRLRAAHPTLDTLSLGMSDDLEAAIAEGATLVRVGTAIFGPRS